MIKPDTLTDEERAEAFDSIRFVLDARQDARTLPLMLRNVVSLRDMAWLARMTGMNRTALFRALALNANPTLRTLEVVLRAFDLRLRVETIRRALAKNESSGSSSRQHSLPGLLKRLLRKEKPIAGYARHRTDETSLARSGCLRPQRIDIRCLENSRLCDGVPARAPGYCECRP